MPFDVATLKREHPDYAINKDTWRNIELLFKGSNALKAVCGEFLTRRPKEPDEVYRARVKRFIYTNLLQTIIGWYTAKVFRREPEIDLNVPGPDGKPSDSPIPTDQAKFFQDFELNCDRRGTTFIDLYRTRLEHLLMYQHSYALLDLPYLDPSQKVTLADQQRNGGLNPYLCLYTPLEITNWETDDFGNFEWVTISTCFQDRTFLGDIVNVDRWTMFDRESFNVYERRYPDGQMPPETAELVREGKHATTDLGQVPLYKMSVAEGLWLGNRCYLPCLDHLNTENAYAWALMNNNLAVPVITGADEDKLTMSEVGAYILPEGGKFAYTEQSGVAFKISGERLDQIREEIYRVCYLIAQGRNSSASASASSGLSKQQDMQPANDVLNCYGDVIRADQQKLLKDVGKVQEFAELYVDVRGYSFEGANPIDELDLLDAGMALNIPSETLDKELLKKAGRLLLDDSNQNLIAKVMEEIDAAPSKAERAAIEAAAEAQMMTDKIRQAVDTGKTPVAPGGPPKSSGGGSASKTPGGKTGDAAKPTKTPATAKKTKKGTDK